MKKKMSNLCTQTREREEQEKKKRRPFVYLAAQHMYKLTCLYTMQQSTSPAQLFPSRQLICRKKPKTTLSNMHVYILIYGQKRWLYAPRHKKKQDEEKRKRQKNRSSRTVRESRKETDDPTQLDHSAQPDPRGAPHQKGFTAHAPTIDTKGRAHKQMPSCSGTAPASYRTCSLGS